MPQITLKDYLRESRLFRVRAGIASVGMILLLLILILSLFLLRLLVDTVRTSRSDFNRSI